MSPINIGLIFVAVLNLGMALLIWLRNPKNKINISFALTIFFLATWTFSISVFREATTVLGAWIWTWVQNGSGALVVIPFFLFTNYFPHQGFRFTLLHKFVIGISISVVLWVVITPGLWTEQIVLMPYANDYYNNRWGLGYFTIHFYTYLIYSFYLLYNKFYNSSGFTRK